MHFPDDPSRTESPLTRLTKTAALTTATFGKLAAVHSFLFSAIITPRYIIVLLNVSLLGTMPTPKHIGATTEPQSKSIYHTTYDSSKATTILTPTRHPSHPHPPLVPQNQPPHLRSTSTTRRSSYRRTLGTLSSCQLIRMSYKPQTTILRTMIYNNPQMTSSSTMHLFAI